MKLMGALALLVLLVAISFEHVHADCEPGWFPIRNGRCGMLLANMYDFLSYDNAVSWCMSEGAELPGPKYKVPINEIDISADIWINTQDKVDDQCKHLANGGDIGMIDCNSLSAFMCIKLPINETAPVLIEAHACDDPLVQQFDGGVLSQSVEGEYLLSIHPDDTNRCYFELTVVLVSNNDPILPQIYIESATIYMESVTIFFGQEYLQLVGDNEKFYADYLEGDRFYDWPVDRVFSDNGCIIFDCDMCPFTFMWCPKLDKTCLWLKLGYESYFGIGLRGLFGNADGDLVNDFDIPGIGNVHGLPEQNVEMRNFYEIP